MEWDNGLTNIWVGGREDQGTHEAILNYHSGPLSNMRCHQKMGCHFEIGFMQKLIEGTEDKPLRFLFQNNNVTAPFALAFTQVNNALNHSSKDDAPLYTDACWVSSIVGLQLLHQFEPKRYGYLLQTYWGNMGWTFWICEKVGLELDD